MLEYHLNEFIDASSRNKEFIEDSVEWIISHFNVNQETEIADVGHGPVAVAVDPPAAAGTCRKSHQMPSKPVIQAHILLNNTTQTFRRILCLSANPW